MSCPARHSGHNNCLAPKTLRPGWTSQHTGKQRVHGVVARGDPIALTLHRRWRCANVVEVAIDRCAGGQDEVVVALHKTIIRRRCQGAVAGDDGRVWLRDKCAVLLNDTHLGVTRVSKRICKGHNSAVDDKKITHDPSNPGVCTPSRRSQDDAQAACPDCGTRANRRAHDTSSRRPRAPRLSVCSCVAARR